MSSSELIIRNMHRKELDRLVDWAATEGWNPGLSDARIFWETDPEAFIAAELSGEMIGGGSIASYGGHYGFMGFFIIHPQHRGRGLGNRLWHERLVRLIARLNSLPIIGMDGVFEMQDYYARGGFSFAHRDLRFEGMGKNFPAPGGIVPINEVSFTELSQYDSAHFAGPRNEFLRRWITQDGVHAMAAIHDDRIAGFGVMRPCRTGFKIGPLFANNAKLADDLYRTLARQVPGQALFLDVPEINPAAMALARQHNMIEVFGCARMYYGPKPALPEDEIFGITTFELG